MVEVTAVLANGNLVKVNWENDLKDLMWGLMGAGGNQLALVLDFKMKIHKTPENNYSVAFIEYFFE